MNRKKIDRWQLAGIVFIQFLITVPLIIPFDGILLVNRVPLSALGLLFSNNATFSFFAISLYRIQKIDSAIEKITLQIEELKK